MKFNLDNYFKNIEKVIDHRTEAFKPLTSL